MEVDLERERRGRQQEERSALRLEKLVADGSQLVSNVAVAGDSKEVLHRQEEEEARKARYAVSCRHEGSVLCLKLSNGSNITYMYSLLVDTGMTSWRQR